MARLGDLITISSSSKVIDGDKYWLLNLDMIEQQTGRILDFMFVDKSKLDGSIIKFDTDTVLYSKLRPNLNKVVVPPMDGYGTSELLTLKPDVSKLNKNYLAVYLRSDAFVTWAVSKTAGAKMPRLGTKELLNKDIPLPSLYEQERMSDCFGKIDSLISLRKQQLSKLDELVKSRFIEMFDGKYKTKPLQAVCEELFAGGDVKKDKYSDTQSEEYPYPIYTNGEKDNGFYGYTSIVRVEKEAVTISGRGTIGFTCLRKEPFYPAVRLIVAVPKQELVSGCYLQHFIQSKNYGGQGASIPQLTVPMIKDEPIPMPPMDFQKQFATFVEQTDKSKFEIQQSLEKLETLKKALMQKYFG